VTLSPKKAYFNFPDIKLLGRVVNAFGIATQAEKLDAIRKITFPGTLKQLETYIGLLNWFRDHVYGYAAIIRPLQDRKKIMLQDLAKQGGHRTRGPAKMQVTDPSPEEKAAFGYL